MKYSDSHVLHIKLDKEYYDFVVFDVNRRDVKLKDYIEAAIEQMMKLHEQEINDKA